MNPPVLTPPPPSISLVSAQAFRVTARLDGVQVGMLEISPSSVDRFEPGISVSHASVHSSLRSASGLESPHPDFDKEYYQTVVGIVPDQYHEIGRAHV